MTQPSLLVLAAGIGSRYGGLKQMDPIGPSGETLMDYSIYDALRAGFGKLVFAIRRDFEEPFRNTIVARFEKRAPVVCVFQELENLPPGFSIPPNRKKPWGTGQAVLSAAETIHEPFGVINADDFYGARSFQVLADHLRSGSPDFAMVAFVLRQTLSEHGSVARGVCKTNAEDFLDGVTEIVGIEKNGDGARYVDNAGTLHRLAGDEPVSLNLWGFTPDLFGDLRGQFIDFLKKHGQDEKTEFYIPAAVNELVATRRARVKVLRTSDSWFGITYREDRPRVMEGIRRLIKRGDYSEELWT